MTSADDIWEDLFHGCAFMACVERAIIEQGPPDPEGHPPASLPAVRGGPSREEPAAPRNVNV
jgi:hypothetical protein